MPGDSDPPTTKRGSGSWQTFGAQAGECIAALELLVQAFGHIGPTLDIRLQRHARTELVNARYLRERFALWPDAPPETVAVERNTLPLELFKVRENIRALQEAKAKLEADAAAKQPK